MSPVAGLPRIGKFRWINNWTMICHPLKNSFCQDLNKYLFKYRSILC